jgi:hypothetical protein
MSSDRRRNDALDLAVSDEPGTSGSQLRQGRIVDAEAEKLLLIASLAGQFESHQITDDARAATERILAGRFYVACVGQFKRGKSTLLNALIGEPILPSGVVPVTSVPTILRFGENRVARVRLRNRECAEIAVADIEEYVSEVRNPENRKGVAGLEVFVPSPLLADGMCLVDTPGLGSVIAGNTAATHAFLPQIDAAIVVIGTDPPLAGDELALVESVALEIPDILFVLNKADRATEHEKHAAVSFAREVLERRLQRSVASIFEISALEQLDSGSSHRDWPKLVAALERLAQQSDRHLVREAADRALRHLSSRLLAVVKEERDALTRPFNESVKRIGQLREIVAQAEQSLNDLGYLLSGEQQRLSKGFAERRAAFLKAEREVAHCELIPELKSLRRTNGPRYRRSAMQAAQNIARRHTMPWLETEKVSGEEAYRKTAKRFTELTTDFLSRIRGLATSELAYLPRGLDAEQDFRVRSEFQFYEFIDRARPASPVRYLGDLLLGALQAHLVIDASAHDFLDLLLETNSERVCNDLEQCVTGSRRHFEAEIRTLLRELSAVAERALARARTAHAAGTAAVESSLKKLACIEDDLVRLNRAGVPHLERS